MLVQRSVEILLAIAVYSLLGEKLYLCYLWVARQKSPVDVGSVSSVGVVTFGCCSLEDFLY